MQGQIRESRKEEKKWYKGKKGKTFVIEGGEWLAGQEQRKKRGSW